MYVYMHTYTYSFLFVGAQNSKYSIEIKDQARVVGDIAGEMSVGSLVINSPPEGKPEG